jgi:hypothetical protein
MATLRSMCVFRNLLLSCTLISACGGAAPEMTSQVRSDLGAFTVDVVSDPSPPLRGANRVLYTITDASGAKVDGLALDVVPWMPAHGHGTSVAPTVQARGLGVYQIDQVVFFMPGEWELRTTFVASGDHVTPSFEIP